MIGKIKGQLLNQGFLQLDVKPEEVSVFYKNKTDSIDAIMTLNYHIGFFLEPIQVHNMQEKIKNILKKSKESCQNIDVLLLIEAEHMEGVREICAQNSGVWAVDSRERRLYIYENQPGDFCGLRKIIEGMLSLEKSEIKSKDLTGNTEVFGESARSRENENQPVFITLSLILVNIVVWVVMEAIGDTEDGLFMQLHGAMEPISVLQYGQWWRIFTSMFLHFGAEHLVNNMLMLFLLGRKLEGMGKIRYLTMYILSGVGGNLLSLMQMVVMSDGGVSAGASGCIYGIIGAIAVVVIRNKGKFEGLTTRGLLFMVFLSLYYGFSTTGVNNAAHIGGLICGAVLGLIFYWGKRRKD